MQLSFDFSTRTVYGRTVPTFLEFCAEHGWNSTWPVAVDAVMQHFVMFLNESGLSPETIANTLVAV